MNSSLLRYVAMGVSGSKLLFRAWHTLTLLLCLKFLSEGALDFVKTSLGSEFNQSLGVAATVRVSQILGSFDVS